MKKKWLREIYAKAKKNQKRIVFPEATEPRILKAVQIIVKEKLAKPILVGDEEEIKAKAKKLRVNLKGVQIVDHISSGKIRAYSNTYFKMRKDKGLTEEQAVEAMRNSTYYGVMMLHKNECDGVVCGAVNTTADTLRPALRIIKTKKRFHRVSSMFIMLMESKMYLFADCAVNIYPDGKDLAEIAIDTAETAKRLGIKPKVAMLSFSTKGSALHPFSDKVIEATKIVQAKRPKLMIDGEMQVDAAIIPQIADIKCPGSRLKGDANVLVFPDLQSGNIAYKLVQRLAGAHAVGPIIQGLKKPVNDLSRGCSVRDIVDVTAVTANEAGSKWKF